MNIFYKINLIFLTLIICSIKNYSAQDISGKEQVVVLPDHDNHNFAVIACLNDKLPLKTFDDKAIFLAALYNNIQLIIQLTEIPGSLKNIAKDGKSILHFALLADKPDLQLINFYILKKVDIDKQDNEGNTALHLAALYNLDKIVALLVNNKAKSSLNQNLLTPLHIAVAKWPARYNIIKLLAKDKTALNTRGIYGLTPLFLAVNKANIFTVKILLEAGADITISPDNSMTIFDYIQRLSNIPENKDKKEKLTAIKNFIQKFQASKPS